MTITTEARLDLADAIALGVTVPVLSVAPEVPIPPCVAITAGTPWITPERIGSRTSLDIAYRVMCVTRYSDEHVPVLEALVESVLVALPSGWIVDTVTAPAQLDTGAQGVVLVSEIQIHGSFIAEPPPD